jgi:phenylalanyl-tRNA synthetase beta chain
MGGLDSEIKDDTKSIVIEVASFAQNTIRATSRRLSLHTEASYRFERGTDIQNTLHVARRTAQLIIQCVEELNAGGANLPLPVVGKDFCDQFPEKPNPAMVALRLSQTRLMLGLSKIDQDAIKKIFEGLQFRLVDFNQDRLVYEIPSWRHDIERECDLIEEVGRIYGYDKVPYQMPRMALEPTPEDPFVEFLERVRLGMAVVGFRETISFPFWSDDFQKNLLLTPEHPFYARVRIANPIADDAALMQTSAVPSLLKAVALNRRQGVRGSKLFECARGYLSGDTPPSTFWRNLKKPARHLLGAASADKQRVIERSWLAGVLDQPLHVKSWDTVPADAGFHHMKAVLTKLFTQFGIHDCDYKLVGSQDVMPFLHPQASATITYKGLSLGWLGELHPQVAKKLDLEPVLMFELDLEALCDASSRGRKLESVSWRFPPSTRDLSLVVDSSLTHDDMRASIAKFSGKTNLQSYQLFDIYEDESIGSGKKSVAWSFRFQNPGHTLTDQEVEKEWNDLVAWLKRSWNAEQR